MESAAAVSASGRLQASRASSATSGDSSHVERPGEVPNTNSRHSSVERSALPTAFVDEEEKEAEEGEEAPTGLEAEAEEAEGEVMEAVSEILQPGVSKMFIDVKSFSFVETLATRIPSCKESSVREQFTTRIPFVETRRCIFQG